MKTVTFGIGGPISFVATTRDQAGVLKDPTSLTLTVVDADGHALPGFPVDLADLTRADTGIYEYTWTVSTTQAIGSYFGVWNSVVDGLPEYGKEEVAVVAATAAQADLGERGAFAGYITPRRAKTAATGIDFSDMTPRELRNICLKARRMIDTYCHVPMLPQPHDFRGGVITGEQHSWSIGSDVQYGTRRVYPWHTPLKDITAFRIDVTNRQHVQIVDPNVPASRDDMYLNKSEGYMEVVSLAVTSVGVFGSGLIPNLGLARPVSVTDYTYGELFPVVGEELIPSENAGESLMYEAESQFWDATAEVCVYRNGTKLAAGDYSINYVEGYVLLVSASADDIITADYTYTLPKPIADAAAETVRYLMGERDLSQKGLTGVADAQLEEIHIKRPTRTPSEGADDPELPDAAKILLADYNFATVR